MTGTCSLHGHTYRLRYTKYTPHQNMGENQEVSVFFGKHSINMFHSFAPVIDTMLWCSPLKPLGHTTFTYVKKDATMVEANNNTAGISLSPMRRAGISLACSSSHMASSTERSRIAASNVIENNRSEKHSSKYAIRALD